jgi:Ras-related protein Rab-1A
MKDNEKNEEEKNEEDISSFPKLIKVTDNSSSHKYIFRICLLGDSGVGKTSLLTRYCDSIFKDKYSNTIGVDFRVVTLKYKDILTKIHIWDTAGQERFKSIAVNYFRTSNGFIFCFDITQKKSFDNVKKWVELAFSNNDSNKVNFLIGNKMDLNYKREVDIEEAENFAKTNKFTYVETSSKENTNVEKVFEFFTYKLISYYEKNQEEYQGDSNQRRLSKAHVINTVREKKKCNC